MKKVPAYAEIPAEALIDGGDEIFPKEAPNPVILRDDQSSAESSTRAFSKSLSAVVAAIASNGGLSEARAFPRLAEGGELAIFSLWVLALAFLATASDFVKYLGVLVLAVLAVAAQWIAAGSGSLWLPGLAMLATTVVALGVLLFFGRNRVAEAPPLAAVISIPIPEPAEEPEAKPAARPGFSFR